jgi:serine phosphatase RsbU (regulator of sigma subunit)
MARPSIQVILGDDGVPAALHAALQELDVTAVFWPLTDIVRRDPTTADALVVVVPQHAEPLATLLRKLFDRLAEHPRATLVLTPGGDMPAALEHPAMVPVAHCAGHDQHELAVRLSMLLEMRESLESLHNGLLARRRSGESVTRRYVSQLRLASQVQREFLPETLPDFGPFRFDVLFRPVDYVSGDIYDVHRLDEEHIGIALADASGHGIPAALLTVYIKRALRGKEIENGSYRILPPNEVLDRLNEDILDAHLHECPFVAAAYGVLNTRTYELTIARGGAPYPILRTAAGRMQLLDPPGSVVGVLPEARFQIQTTRLAPGDSVVFYSDGLERVVAPEATVRDVPEVLEQAAAQVGDTADQLLTLAAAPHTPATFAPTDHVHFCPTCGDDLPVPPCPTAYVGHAADDPESVAPHDIVSQSPWFDLVRRQGVTEALRDAGQRQRSLRQMGYPLDDLTMIALHVDR